MGNLIPCRHLNYDTTNFPDCTIETLAPSYPTVRYWKRPEQMVDNGPGEKRNPQNVQFCGQGRGRINSIFACYNGELSCYQPNEDAA